MVKPKLFALVVLVPVCVMTSIARGQDLLLAGLYGEGVHAYFARNYQQAHTHFTEAIDQGLRDPRCYYFRGLTYVQLGRPQEAEADFQQGAELEVNGQGQFYPVSESLQRVQGSTRLKLEGYRRQARLAAHYRDEATKRARYGDIRQAQPSVVRGASPPLSQEQLPPLPANVPPDANAPFSDAPAATSIPSETSSPKVTAEPDPFGGGATTSPPPAQDDPFGTPTTEPMPPATMPAADPFGSPPPTTPAAPEAKPAADPSSAPTQPVTPANDPFGSPAPPTTPPKAQSDDPFGGDNPFGAPKQPATPPQTPTNDPFGGNVPAQDDKVATAPDQSDGGPLRSVVKALVNSLPVSGPPNFDPADLFSGEGTPFGDINPLNMSDDRAPNQAPQAGAEPVVGDQPVPHPAAPQPPAEKNPIVETDPFGGPEMTPPAAANDPFGSNATKEPVAGAPPADKDPFAQPPAENVAQPKPVVGADLFGPPTDLPAKPAAADDPFAQPTVTQSPETAADDPFSFTKPVGDDNQPPRTEKGADDSVADPFGANPTTEAQMKAAPENVTPAGDNTVNKPILDDPFAAEPFAEVPPGKPAHPATKPADDPFGVDDPFAAKPSTPSAEATKPSSANAQSAGAVPAAGNSKPAIADDPFAAEDPFAQPATAKPSDPKTPVQDDPFQ